VTPEIDDFYEQIGLALFQCIDKAAVKAWIHAEILDDTGVVRVHYKTSDAGALARGASRGLEKALYRKFDALRRRWAADSFSTTATYSWDDPTEFSIHFGYEDKGDPADATERSDRRPQQQAGKRDASPPPWAAGASIDGSARLSHTAGGA
jgi:hypothetical protein